MYSFIIILTGILGAVLTYFISTELKQGPVRASAGLSLIVALCFYYYADLIELFGLSVDAQSGIMNEIPLVFIGASFIGMASSEVLHSYILLFVSGLIFSIIYLNTSKFFNGYGGALGTTACISLIASLSLMIYTKRAKEKVKNRAQKKF
ncbi:hypothetical protein [Chondrinema litorale]|uniref:hypothetical protein n=1 Tax=Chondrinema litorale TaxID=2994555 RepID=UPI0025431A52|nr:hypothetical protein [Chondrinema litorale]UZR94299.1 hypothetical protein OQ292_00520 [Chondrinema litorale]